MLYNENVLGLVASALASRYTNPKLAIMLLYFSLMQLIHAMGYAVAGDCTSRLNRVLSYANYVHICFQPVISTIGAWGLLEFAGKVDHDVRIKFRFALKLCIVGGAFLAARMFGSTSDEIHKSCVWCGEACSFEGRHHITFSLPLKLPGYTSPSIFLHLFLMFVPLLFISKLSALISGVLALTTFLPMFFIPYSPLSEAGTIFVIVAFFSRTIGN